ncbi:SRPBCC family protein [Mycolicibacterium hodleri]|uniref:SRPBCC family protein n=1 Tax=Mycolicibacterium hodleri TaxID=49897 RepID=A0A502EBC9_9MYCO|nr:SRPBCC family protein [Mycolicibacterium hodleri]TPG35035.1 hypothetical protein EAH80_09605 [Mycolicibacterium hodleri]
MPTFTFSETTTATPQSVLDALTDFGPQRSKLFPNSADKYLEVHAKTATTADVTEGSSGVWERLHYDWSDPHRIHLRTVDSNTWSNKSGHEWVLTPQVRGTRVDVTVIRDPKNLRGRVVGGLLLRFTGRRLIGGQLRSLLTGLE